MGLHRIMLAGPSGVGKTTLSKSLSKSLGRPFISGSISDADPTTRDIPQYKMIESATLEKDIKYLKDRVKEYTRVSSYISDRSFLDNMAYANHKLSHKISTCDMEDFYRLCINYMYKMCDLIILVPYDYNIMKNTWDIQDNNKRATNKIFQDLMFTIFERVLETCFVLTDNRILTDYKGVRYGESYSMRPSPYLSNSIKTIKLITLNPNCLVQGRMPTEMGWYGDLIKLIQHG